MSIEATRFLDFDLPDVLQDICRWAALIYSDMVLFPLPASAGVKPRLASAMREAIERFETVSINDDLIRSTLFSPGASNVLLWALMLGGLASIFTKHNVWYTRTLARHLSMSPRELDWPAFKDVMSSFLWWDYIFEEPGARLWWEARLCCLPEDTITLSSGSDLFSNLPSSDGWSPATWPSQNLSPSDL